MQPDHTSRIDAAFETLKEALTPYVQDAMEAVYGAQWRREAQKGLRDPYLLQKTWDVHALLLVMSNNWNAVFSQRLGEQGRTLVGELRTRHSHDAPPALNPSDAYRTLDTVARLLHAVGDEAGAQRVQQEAVALMQRQFQPTPSDEDAPPPKEETEAAGETEATEETEAAGETETAEQAEGAEEVPVAASDAAEPAETPDEEQPASTTAGVRSWFGRLFHKADEKELEPLELRTRLLDKVENALQRFRSQRPLPFNQITVHILAPASGDRFTYDAALNDLAPPFEQAVLNRLLESGFDLPDILTVKPQIHTHAPKKLEPQFEEAGPIVIDLRKQTTRASATITVVKGKAEKRSYRIHSKEGPVNVGRLREVEEDRYGHVIRHNHIAFLDHTDPAFGEEERAINETVSRQHAHFEYDAQTGVFVLFNDQGVTSISRTGLPHPVRVSHQAAPLQDGDMIYLGRACLRFDTRRRG